MADIPARLLKLSGMKADDIRSWAEVSERGELVIVDMSFRKHFFPLMPEEKPAMNKTSRGRQRDKRNP